MRPFFNPFFPLPNQGNSYAAAPPIHQQNPPHSNPQAMGMMNHQFHATLTNPNFPQLNGFLNPQNNSFNAPLQPNQFNLGPQLGVPNFGTNPFVGPLCNLMQNGSQMNAPQLALQNLVTNGNMPQQMNQNLATPNMQQFPLQDLSQLLPPSLLANNLPYAPATPNVLRQNQLDSFQPMGNVNAFKSKPPLNRNFRKSQQDSFQPMGNINAFKSKPHHNHKFQPNGFSRPGGHPANCPQSNTSTANGSGFCHDKFSRNPKGGISKFQKPHFNGLDKGKRNGFYKGIKGKGHQNMGPGEHDRFHLSINKEEDKARRSVAVLYTEKEILQWREERRRNYPSRMNIEKKLKRKQPECDADEETKMRSQRLKEILAKQAELGVEVAEIPSHYFSEAKELRCVKEENETRLFKNKRFQSRQNSRATFKNQNNKRKRYDKADKFSKKQRFCNKDVYVPPFRERSPTLLKKLLSSDIKKDKYNLLQVFRFMVMNSYFKGGLEQPLKFPLVVVKESGAADEVPTENPPVVKGIPDAKSNGKEGELEVDKGGDPRGIDREDCENDTEEVSEEGRRLRCQAYLGINKENVNEEAQNQDEEGEIID